MKTIASQENSTPSRSSQPFFDKKAEGGFFAPAKEVAKPFFSPAVIQTKLTINEPGDQYEQEADAMAERVMRMPQSPILSSSSGEGKGETAKPLPISSLQRKCAACEEEEKVQRQEMEEEEEPLQAKPLMRKSAIGGGYTASPQLSSQLSSSKGGGSPLPGQTLGFMNQTFGSDFSKVRIHTGSQAAEMSQGIQAKAFTHGSDVYFNQGQYSPESSEGKRLLGHELTHVVQQSKQHSYHVIQKKNGLATGGRTTTAQSSDPIKEALAAAVTEYKTIWKNVTSFHPSYHGLGDWIKKGDAVVALIENHTNAALEASQKGKSHLFKLYLQIIESDTVMFSLIAWHVFYYAYLIYLGPKSKDLLDVMIRDTREFTNEAEMREFLELIIKLSDGYPKEAAIWLGKIDISQPIVVKQPGLPNINITVTNASIESNKQIFEQRAAHTAKVMDSVNLLASEINDYLSNARKEGLLQAVQALSEFIMQRGGRIRGPKPSVKPRPKPQAPPKTPQRPPQQQQQQKPPPKQQQKQKLIEISQEMKSISIGEKGWRQTLNFTNKQENIVYVLKDNKGKILKIGSTTQKTVADRFSKYLTCARKLGINVMADVFTLDKNSDRNKELLEKEVRTAFGTGPWDNTDRKREGSGLPTKCQ